MDCAVPTGPLAGRRLVLGLSGGVACYKAAELLRLLTQAGATVTAAMTESAQRFLGVATLQALSGRRVHTEAWDPDTLHPMPHINLGREAEALIYAPASADLLARLALGRADDLLSLTALARPRARCALLLAPAMNREMWSHPATQRHVARLREDGAFILGPGHGAQACGEVGDGRMLEPSELLDAVVAHFQPKHLAGRQVLITAGPTFELIDPVRGLTNLSSGKMGFALARAAAEAGAEVTLVAGPVHLPTPQGVQRVDVQGARDMLAAVQPRAAALGPSGVFIATAAVADWRPAALAPHKLKKDGKKVPPVLELTENPDILASVAAAPGAPYCVGFAAESEQLEQHARDKLRRKRLPLVVGNLGPATFGRDDNLLLLVDEHQARPLPADGRPADKQVLARALVAEIAQRLAAAGR